MKLGKTGFILFIILISLIVPASLFAADDVTGLWKTIDDETGLPKGVVAVYKYQGKVFGRIIATFDDSGKTLEDDMYRKIYTSPFIKGEPSFSELTIIWDMQDKGRKWARGKIMDPGDDEKEPGIYDCEMWIDDDTLIVKGKILMFGRSQTWYPIKDSEFPKDFIIPDWKAFKPEIPEVE